MKMSTGVDAMKMPERPPITNIETKPSANSIGTVKRMLPPHSVPSQLKVLIADGTAMTIVEIMKLVPSVGFMPLWNMWCPHTIQLRKAMRDDRERHRAVAEDRLAGEDRQDLRGDAHRRQDHDVDLGVAEEPEEVLPEQRLAAARRQEEAGARHAIEEQHRERGGQHGQREQQQDGGDEERPDRQRHAEERHARRPHVDDGRDVVDRAHQRRDAEDDDADAPQVLAPGDAGVRRHRGERRVGRPAAGGGTSRDHERRQHDDAPRPSRPRRTACSAPGTPCRRRRS